MRVINLVDRMDRVNLGIWNAALATAEELKAQFGAESEVWFPAQSLQARPEELHGATPRPLDALDTVALGRVSAAAGLDPARDVIVSHGCWRYPTRWAWWLARRGFAWLAVPHGMLEPWSVSEKRLRKWVYFHLFERRAFAAAARIRAVGRPEHDNLRKRFGDRVVWIPNGVPAGAGQGDAGQKPARKAVLFMARLHHKKGVRPLLEGWKASRLCNDPAWILRIAGPDDGELQALQQFLRDNPAIRNVEYLGPVYGDAKARLLRDSHFYILPSFSEGFPTSVLEAMQHGLVPLISKGCNFPDVFECALGFPVEPDISSVRLALDRIHGLPADVYADHSARARHLIDAQYTNQKLAVNQMQLFADILPAPLVS